MLPEDRFEPADRAIIVKDVEVLKSLADERVQIQRIRVLELDLNCTAGLQRQNREEAQERATQQQYAESTAGKWGLEGGVLTGPMQSTYPYTFDAPLLRKTSARQPVLRLGQFAGSIEAMLADIATKWNHPDCSKEEIHPSLMRSADIEFTAFRAFNAHGRSLPRPIGVLK